MKQTSKNRNKLLQDRASLDRIRDNQRRSRLERRQHVQRLQQKVAQYEAEGVKASIEMQRAGRMALEENRMLRCILNEQGISDGDITARLNLLRKSPDSNSSSGNVAQVLEKLLGPLTGTFDASPDEFNQISPGFESQPHGHGISYNDMAMEANMGGYLPTPACDDARYFTPSGGYEVMGHEESERTYQHPAPGFTGVGQGFFPNYDSSRHRPSTMVRGRWPQPTNLWEAGPQISPASSTAMGSPPMVQDQISLGPPMHLSSQQEANLPVAWPAHMYSAVNASCGSITTQGNSPLIPSNSSVSGYFDRLKIEDGCHVEDYPYSESKKKFHSR
ncbi:uncharacterized protein JN550_001041 [Neoarthrinium moseri]|uniref:uncharacterized protein n=1 Tax=Neoarthrinium moseri TaxID=1658444 RepID=UPI001FDC8390|nr:uncharacterized protein JN550_001041 [Neoarthrinium moseri]KAI1876969.1 hypothetical protein JN550_001041 [Neoarthrinium moseri]